MKPAPNHEADLRRLRRRAAAVPVVSTIGGSSLAIAPIVADTPTLPPTGLLILLAWRFLRPELWPCWIGLPLGLCDDLLSGRALGTAMTLWTAILLAIDATEDRMAWRGKGEEWLFAAVACGLATLGQWAAANLTGGDAPIWVTAPSLLAGILLFPLAQRLCAVLDRWRLRP